MTRLIAALTGWFAAATVLAHPGDHPHAHPHLDLFVIVLLLAAVAGGLAWALRRHRTRRDKRSSGE